MCTTGNDVLHNHGIDGQNFASISKEVHSLVPNAFVFSHTLQGEEHLIHLARAKCVGVSAMRLCSLVASSKHKGRIL